MAAAKLIPKPVEGVPEAIESNRRNAKYHYDKKCRNLPPMETGSPVYVQLNLEASKQWIPGTVGSKLNDRSLIVDVAGAQYRRDLAHLKPRKEPINAPAQSSLDGHQGSIGGCFCVPGTGTCRRH